MPLYEYQAIDKRGRNLNGVMPAEDELSLDTKLRDAGLWLTDATITWGFPGVLDKPVAADMDGDGITDIGLWVPRTDATNPFGVAQWYFLISNDFTVVNGATVPAAHTAGSIAKINHAFSPSPLGHDIYAEFGDERSLPIVGNFAA